jgi:hypothetical protein
VQHAEPSPPLRKLDFVTDASGYISMLIYNTHPPGGLLIAPKYYPDPNGTWTSHATGQRYSRFEYYWNLKQQTKGKSSRVYEVDKNPLHDYATDVVNRFNQHLATDPCHGVPMYRLPRDTVARYWDAKSRYRDVLDHRPAHLDKFSPFLEKMSDTFGSSQVGITGSYLYDLYQDFSDINFVIYDDAVSDFHDMLVTEDALLHRQDMEVIFPGPSWPGWLNGSVDVLDLLPASTKQKTGKTIVPVKNRFIGSMHDPADDRTRAGFWLGNTVDPHPHGTFKKVKLGIAVVTGHVTNWTEDLPSGYLRVEGVELLGIHPALDFTPKGKADALEPNKTLDLARKVDISAVQVIGEFNRMFITDEDVIAFGLVEEIAVAGKTTPVHELLVGSREVGGWIFPREEITA